MNKFRMTRAGIDVNQGLQRLFGDVDLYEQLLVKVLDDTNYHDMLQAISEKDAKKAFSAAHSLKGVAGNLSMTALYDAVYPLVEELRNGNVEVDSYLPTVTEAYDKAVKAIGDLKK